MNTVYKISLKTNNKNCINNTLEVNAGGGEVPNRNLAKFNLNYYKSFKNPPTNFSLSV